MPNIFHPRANPIVRGVLATAAMLPVAAIGLGYALDGSSYVTREEIARAQPVPFSHRHHVQGVGLDCRYCHTAVEDNAFAGLPPTHTCMTCHSQLFSDSPLLEPVRRSYREGTPIRWVRVHDLPDFVAFDHSIHIHRGVGCSTCHGRVDDMPLTWLQNPLRMQWCLECHRNPTPYLRPPERVFDMTWKGAEAKEPGAKAAETALRVPPPGERSEVEPPVHCNACHQ